MKRLRICIFGAGAIGGYLASKLAKQTDVDLSIIARGEHLAAIRAHGLRVQGEEGESVVTPAAASDDASQIGPQDVVLVTVKSYAQSAAASAIAQLMGDTGYAVFVANGIPWWWNYGGAAQPDSTRPQPTKLDLLDPEGALWKHVGPERVLGCVAYSTNYVHTPGVVVHARNNHWIIGEPSNALSDRVLACAEVLRRVGVNAEASTNIRRAIWVKLLRNGALSSLAALTRCGIGTFGQSEEMLGIADDAIDEMVRIAATTGFDVREEAPRAKLVARDAANRVRTLSDDTVIASDRPSMLEDVLRGRPLETEAILGQPYRFALEAKLHCSRIATLLPLLRMLDAQASH
jgi:2-dehydropantoate 2-reductase